MFYNRTKSTLNLIINPGKRAPPKKRPSETLALERIELIKGVKSAGIVLRLMPAINLLLPPAKPRLKKFANRQASEPEKSALINFSDVVTEDYELQRG